MAAATIDELVSYVLSLLESRRRLDRERGTSKLQQLYDDNAINSEFEDTLIAKLKKWLSDNESDVWERRHGAIMTVIVMIQAKTVGSPFIQFVKNLIPDLLEDTESRIRIETGILSSSQSAGLTT